MFDKLIRDLTDQELAHLLRVVDGELDNVRKRLLEKTGSNDSMVAILAHHQLEILDVWKPSLLGMVEKLEKPE